MRRIFVIEDDENIREMIRIALTSFAYEVSVFDNAEDALRQIGAAPPDMAIFDIMLPGMSGLEATKTLRNNPKTKWLPVMMLTAKDTEIDKVAGLDCGADDYMTKPFGVMELGARVRSLLRRAVPDGSAGEEEAAAADLTVNRKTREASLRGTPLDLTFKEFELLWYLLKERGRIVEREELLNEIWGYDFVGESRTLDIHIRTLRRKLQDDAEDPKYIKTIRNVGYRFIGE